MKMAIYDLEENIRQGLNDANYEAGYLSSMVESIRHKLVIADDAYMLERAREEVIDMIDNYLEKKGK